MQYKSVQALNEFSFADAAIASIAYFGGSLTLELDNVTILANNSHNRDIHDMRANNVIVTFTEATISKVVAEGYKVYDANNQLKETIDDTIISPDDYAAFFKERENNTIYSIDSSDDTHCIISIDSEYETYLIEADYSQSIVEWDRFLKKE